MALFILALLIFISSKILGLQKNKTFDIVKAMIIIILETFIASILFVIMNLIHTIPVINSIMVTNLNSLFINILMFAVIIGYILYWINRWAFKKFNISREVLTLCEYIIQWSLIYSTIYQILFDEIMNSFKDTKLVDHILTLNITKPSDLLFLVLPALISIWISIIAYKHYKDQL